MPNYNKTHKEPKMKTIIGSKQLPSVGLTDRLICSIDCLTAQIERNNDHHEVCDDRLAEEVLQQSKRITRRLQRLARVLAGLNADR